jgi:hypothetical protein
MHYFIFIITIYLLIFYQMLSIMGIHIHKVS